MKTLIALFCFALTACATSPDAPTAKETVISINQPVALRPTIRPVVDERCANLSKTARSIAVVRDAGISQADAPLMVKTTTFPLAPMIQEVYSRRDITPIVGATNSYAVCTEMGFDAMQAALVKADEALSAAEVQRAKNDLVAKKTAKSRKK